MKSKSAIWVGAVVLIALASFFVLFLYLSHQDPDTYKIKVQFDDTQGLSRQSIVRMQGVNIGEVTEVLLVLVDGAADRSATGLPLGEEFALKL